MRAIVVHEFGGIENAALDEIPDPAPCGSEVLVEVRAAVVNFVDLLMIGGTYQVRPALPFIPGKVPAGVVRAIGPDAASFTPGERVLALIEQGGFAELALVKAPLCVRLPASVSPVDATSMSTVFDTAWFALHERARLQRGETVLVVGASGGVGLAALQLAKASGARTLAGIANPAKADLVREAGADELIDLSRADLRDSLREQVYAVTDSRGADVVLDMLGGDMFDAAIRSLAWSGRLVVIGFAAGRIATLKTNYLLLKNIAISGVQVSDYRRRAPQQTAACWAELFALCEQGRIRPLPTTVLPLERAGDAFRAVRERTARGRIVLSPLRGARRA
jgi:NADPH:quinone reductase